MSFGSPAAAPPTVVQGQPGAGYTPDAKQAEHDVGLGASAMASQGNFYAGYPVSMLFPGAYQPGSYQPVQFPQFDAQQFAHASPLWGPQSWTNAFRPIDLFTGGLDNIANGQVGNPFSGTGTGPGREPPVMTGGAVANPFAGQALPRTPPNPLQGLGPVQGHVRP